MERSIWEACTIDRTLAGSFTRCSNLTIEPDGTEARIYERGDHLH